MGRADDAERVAAEVTDIERIARSALADVRETIGGYRTRGLVAEMDSARDALSAAGVACEVEGSPATAKLAPGQETVLALTLREAVTNVVRHANASRCRMRFALESGRHTLLVEDDGRHPVEREGNGLRGMRERIELMGGTVRLQRDRGTRLQVELPASEAALR
jgi:two-component system sensor histidine kinase DesK